MEMEDRFLIKDGVDIRDLQKISPNLLIVLGHFILFCKKRKLRCCLTSIMDLVSGRVSKTHEQGRAFDASIRGWTMDDIQACIEHMSEVCGDLGAHSLNDGLQRVVVFHTGTAEHFHFQVKE
jgi:hypothetical protein